jgi:hypothetical protein
MTRDEAVVVLVHYLQSAQMDFPDWPSFRKATKMMSDEAKKIHERENKKSAP